MTDTDSRQGRRILPPAAPGGGEDGLRPASPTAGRRRESAYDAIARLYDPWSRSVTEDVAFYVAEAVTAAPGPIVELGVGTGRIAIPIASEGVRVIGVDSSAGMLEICREQADLAGVGDAIDLRLGDFRHPPVTERVRLVICPFRAYLHLQDDTQRLEALRTARDLLIPGGILVFDVFTPSADDVAETHRRWIEREPGIYEHADWDPDARTLTLSIRSPSDETTMSLAWIEASEWRALVERAGFEIDACFGWFDRRPWAGDEDSVWIARRPGVG